jgi:hypothetical protein
MYEHVLIPHANGATSTAQYYFPAFALSKRNRGMEFSTLSDRLDTEISIGWKTREYSAVPRSSLKLQCKNTATHC